MELNKGMSIIKSFSVSTVDNSEECSKTVPILAETIMEIFPKKVKGTPLIKTMFALISGRMLKVSIIDTAGNKHEQCFQIMTMGDATYADSD